MTRIIKKKKTKTNRSDMRIGLFDVPQVNILVMCAFSTNNTTVINDTTNKFTSIFRFLNERWNSNVKESIYFKRLRLILIFRTCHLFLILFVLKTSQISKTVKFSVTKVILVDNHAVLLIHPFKKKTVYTISTKDNVRALKHKY